MSGYANINGTYSPDVRWVPEDISGTTGALSWPSSVGDGSIGIQKTGSNYASGLIGTKPALNINPSTSIDHTKKIALKLDSTNTYLGSNGITTVCVVQDFWGDPTVNSFTRFINWLDSTPNGVDWLADEQTTNNIGILVRDSSGNLRTVYTTGGYVSTTGTVSHTIVGTTPAVIVARYDPVLTKFTLWINKGFNHVHVSGIVNLDALDIQYIGLGYVPDAMGNSFKGLGGLKVSEVMFWNSALTDQQIKNLTQDILVEYGVRTPITHTPAYDAINATYSPSIWWKPEDIGGLNTGGKVQWYSSVGSGYISLQGTASNFSANYLGGKTALRINPASIFDDTKYFDLNTGSFRTNQSFTLAFMVSDFFVFDGNNHGFIQIENSTGAGGYVAGAFLILNLGTTNLKLRQNNLDSVFTPALAPNMVGSGTTPVLFVFRYNVATQSYRTYYNTAFNSVHLDITRNLSVLNWDVIRLGGYGVGGPRPKLSISEIMIWDTALSDSQIRNLSNDLLIEYGVRTPITYTPGYAAINATYSPTVRWQPEDIGGLTTPGNVQWYSSVGNGYAQVEGTAAHFVANDPDMNNKNTFYSDPSTGSDTTKYLKLNLGQEDIGSKTIVCVVSNCGGVGGSTSLERFIVLLSATVGPQDQSSPYHTVFLSRTNTNMIASLHNNQNPQLDWKGVRFNETIGSNNVYVVVGRFNKGSSVREWKTWANNTSDNIGYNDSITGTSDMKWRHIQIGLSYLNGSAGKIKISEILYFNRALTDADVDNLTGDLLTEYGVTRVPFNGGYSNIDTAYYPEVRFKSADINDTGGPGALVWNSSVGNGSILAQGGALTTSTIDGKPAIYCNPATLTTTNQFLQLQLDPTTPFPTTNGFTLGVVVQDLASPGGTTSTYRIIDILDNILGNDASPNGTNLNAMYRDSSATVYSTRRSDGVRTSWSLNVGTTPGKPLFLVFKSHPFENNRLYVTSYSDTGTLVGYIAGTFTGILAHTIAFGDYAVSHNQQSQIKVSEVMFWDYYFSDNLTGKLAQDILEYYMVRAPQTPAYAAINQDFEPDLRWIPEDISGSNGALIWNASVGTGVVVAQGGSSHFSTNYLGGKSAVIIDATSQTQYTKYLTLDVDGFKTNQSFTIAFIVSDFNSFGIGNSAFIELLNTSTGAGGPTESQLLYTLSNTNLRLNHTSGSSDFSPALVPDTVGSGTEPVLFVFRYILGTGLRIYYNTLTNSIRVDDNRDLSVLNWRYIRFGGTGGSNCTALSVSEIMGWNRDLSDQEITDLSQTMLLEYGVRTNTPVPTGPESTGAITIIPSTTKPEFKGIWAAGIYAVNDIIFYTADKKLYKCIQITVDEVPTNASYWEETKEYVVRTNSSQLPQLERESIFEGINLLQNINLNGYNITGVTSVVVDPPVAGLTVSVSEVTYGSNYKLVINSDPSPILTQGVYTATVTFSSNGDSVDQDVIFTVDNKPEFIGFAVKNLGPVSKNNSYISPTPVIIEEDGIVTNGELQLNDESIDSIEFELWYGLTKFDSVPAGMIINTSTRNLEIPLGTYLSTNGTFVGTWSAGVYAVNDVVFYTDNKFYICIQTTTTEEPTIDTGFWTLQEPMTGTYSIKNIVVKDTENDIDVLFGPSAYITFNYDNYPVVPPTTSGASLFSYLTNYVINDGSTTFSSLNILESLMESYAWSRINENNYYVEEIIVLDVQKVDVINFTIETITSEVDYNNIESLPLNYPLIVYGNGADGIPLTNIGLGNYVITFSVKYSAFPGASNENVDYWELAYYSTFKVTSQSTGTQSVGQSGITTVSSTQITGTVNNLFNGTLTQEEIRTNYINYITNSESYLNLDPVRQAEILPVINKLAFVFSKNTSSIIFQSKAENFSTSTGVNLNIIR